MMRSEQINSPPRLSRCPLRRYPATPLSQVPACQSLSGPPFKSMNPPLGFPHLGASLLLHLPMATSAQLTLLRTIEVAVARRRREIERACVPTAVAAARPAPAPGSTETVDNAPLARKRDHQEISASSSSEAQAPTSEPIARRLRRRQSRHTATTAAVSATALPGGAGFAPPGFGSVGPRTRRAGARAQTHHGLRSPSSPPSSFELGAAAHGTVTPIAGGGDGDDPAAAAAGCADGDALAAARFNEPSACVEAPDGSALLIVDTKNHRICALRRDTGVVTTLAGGGAAGAGGAAASGFADGAGAAARFNEPVAAAFDPSTGCVTPTPAAGGGTGARGA